MNAISGGYQQGVEPVQMRQMMQQRAQENFRDADADGNKALSRSEAIDVMIEKGIDAENFSKIFKKVDSDKNGEISIEENMQAQVRRRQAMLSDTPQVDVKEVSHIETTV
ncbi:EF-hand domain-containing protein [uncultured Paraglaciecola sp.]|uniref:EF-hand domain-containing protein n=1 Tax=uncultured Paraglaciecola sp. TaxID=1765024 RepID=UPI0025970748|nr:EF-hand domain-containing protein [uncultured Paraglaciecola sp.]